MKIVDDNFYAHLVACAAALDRLVKVTDAAMEAGMALPNARAVCYTVKDAAKLVADTGAADRQPDSVADGDYLDMRGARKKLDDAVALAEEAMGAGADLPVVEDPEDDRARALWESGNSCGRFHMATEFADLLKGGAV